MGASRSAGARLLGFLVDAQARGVREALRALDLESLAGRPITEIFVGLADYICPGAGTVDEGIAREAYIETVVELASEGLTDLTTFTPDQMQTVFELYATHAIEARICNDIGTKAVTMPVNAQAAHRVEQQLRDFIRGGVSDALTRDLGEQLFVRIYLRSVILASGRYAMLDDGLGFSLVPWKPVIEERFGTATGCDHSQRIGFLGTRNSSRHVDWIEANLPSTGLAIPC